MSYLVLARKWRPQTFTEVIGQRHVSLTLANALKTGRLSHAYLFSGPRGIGKTTMARILAKALNCENGPTAEPCNECEFCRSITEGHALDVLEIDGASNRGIDDVRKLRESVKYAPSSLRAKVYIIDEVHMLTTDAFNALLKTLEEPPKHVHFIMATTEPMKVPATILSRCQRFDFGRVSTDDLRAHLGRIADAEHVKLDEDAYLIITRKAEGSVRDSLTLMDQIFATGEGPFSANDVQQLLGLSGSGLHQKISAAVIAGDATAVLTLLQEAYQQGLNLQEIAEELVHHFRNILFAALGKDLENIIEGTAEEKSVLTEQTSDVRPADALRWLRIMLDVTTSMRQSSHPRVHLEVALVEMATLPKAIDLGRVVDKLHQLSVSAPAIGQPQATYQAPPRPAASPVASVPAPAQAAAPQTRPAKQAEPIATGSDAVEFAQRWPQVINQIMTRKAFLGSCIQDSRVVGYKDGRLQIALEDVNGFKADQVKTPPNRRLVMQAIEEVYGTPMGFKLVEAGSAPPPAAAPTKAPAVQPPPTVAEQPAAPPVRPEPEKPMNQGGESYTPRDQARQIAEELDGDIIGPAL
jgi:DNA polymerase III subunit gamma/tau